jgi:hypothetical protein
MYTKVPMNEIRGAIRRCNRYDAVIEDERGILNLAADIQLSINLNAKANKYLSELAEIVNRARFVLALKESDREAIAIQNRRKHFIAGMGWRSIKEPTAALTFDRKLLAYGWVAPNPVAHLAGVERIEARDEEIRNAAQGVL